MVFVVDGYADLEVVGESFHQDDLWALVGGRTRERVRRDVHAVLLAEEHDQYDVNAISVWVGGRNVGYLGREDAARLRPGLMALQREHHQRIALAGVIVGGGEYDGRPGMVGVFLHYDPAAFGVEAQPRPVWVHAGTLRTGLSVAVDTDEDDDRYDLGWLAGLCGDPTRRIEQLHELLRGERDPISRHYVFAELESTLYGLRDAWPTALPDYDAACVDHDAEMEVIVPALVDKFGVVPLLATYRQAATRHQKAHDLDRALWWAQRGIALYQDNPARSEMLLDLHKRAANYRAKLGSRAS